ncbi:acetyl-CoA carboxylase biotin carboxyl carrier protein [Clostridium massiliamazoniense]|uniref:acetyl-CoA carboxylase biotin carboxyl carrier protein n=1 Tax=Clostridium massiliamazoniense TaxID=1347366 RepID=UPI0006D7D23B|nr:acetyl-CoA carboxylase biotin carboxyl carrier protein [Clostridium massiliamazoniense]
MNITEIKELIDKIDNSNISLFELKLDDNYLKMDKSEVRNTSSSDYSNYESDKSIDTNKNISSKIENNIEVLDKKRDSVDSLEKEIDENLTIITSPMVGTFYEAPGVDLDPFVKVGDSIKEGDTLCIIEAMKLMNELESEINGEIVSIMVKNGEMVEYGKPLFKVRRK